MIKFELQEQFDRQFDKLNRVMARYQSAVTEKNARLTELKLEQESLLRREFSTGDDFSVEKGKLTKRIDEAERELKAAELDYRQALTARSIELTREGRITVRDLVLAWNESYVNQVRSQELQPIVERMGAAREAYLNSILDYWEFDREYEAVFKRMVDAEVKDIRPGDGLGVFEISTPSDLPLIKDSDLFFIETFRKLPDGVNRLPCKKEVKSR